MSGRLEESLKVLKIHTVSSKKIQMDVTSYRTGDFLNESFIFSQDDKAFKVENLSFKTSSVLKKDSKPFSFFPAYQFSFWSLWFEFIIIGFCLLGMLSYLGYLFWRKKQIQQKSKRWVQGLSPQKDIEMRLYKLRTQYEACLLSQKPLSFCLASEILKAFKIYLTRLFSVDVVEMPLDQVVFNLKKYQKSQFLIYEKLVEAFLKDCGEFLNQTLLEKDVYWLFERVEKVVSKMEHLKRKSS